MTLEDAPDVLTVRELAMVLRIGKNQAYALVNSGAVWSRRIGPSIRIPKPAVERFLLGQTSDLIPAGGDGG